MRLLWVYQIGVSTTRFSQSCGDTGIAVFCNSYVCDRCFVFYMLSNVFFKSGLWVCNEVLVDWLISKQPRGSAKLDIYLKRWKRSLFTQVVPISLFLLLNTKYVLKNVTKQLMDPIDFHSDPSNCLAVFYVKKKEINSYMYGTTLGE